MPYKISGELSHNSTVVVIKESDWSVESSTAESAGSYEINGLESGEKLIFARRTIDGYTIGYGNITPESY